METLNLKVNAGQLNRKPMPKMLESLCNLQGNGTSVMNEIYRNGQFVTDTWNYLEDGNAVPETGQVFVTINRWLAEREILTERDSPVGVVIRAGDKFEEIFDDLEDIAAIALEFPKFSDGRSYSTARILNEHAGFKGELRAIGDVLLDQIPFMRRCGIEVFEISHEPTRRSLEGGHNPEISLHTQPVGSETEIVAGARPWLRKGTEKSTLHLLAK